MKLTVFQLCVLPKIDVISCPVSLIQTRLERKNNAAQTIDTLNF